MANREDVKDVRRKKIDRITEKNPTERILEDGKEEVKNRNIVIEDSGEEFVSITVDSEENRSVSITEEKNRNGVQEETNRETQATPDTTVRLIPSPHDNTTIPGLRERLGTSRYYKLIDIFMMKLGLDVHQMKKLQLPSGSFFRGLDCTLGLYFMMNVLKFILAIVIMWGNTDGVGIMIGILWIFDSFMKASGILLLDYAFIRDVRLFQNTTVPIAILLMRIVSLAVIFISFSETSEAGISVLALLEELASTMILTIFFIAYFAPHPLPVEGDEDFNKRIEDMRNGKKVAKETLDELVYSESPPEIIKKTWTNHEYIFCCLPYMITKLTFTSHRIIVRRIPFLYKMFPTTFSMCEVDQSYSEMFLRDTTALSFGEPLFANLQMNTGLCFPRTCMWFFQYSSILCCFCSALCCMVTEFPCCLNSTIKFGDPGAALLSARVKQRDIHTIRECLLESVRHCKSVKLEPQVMQI